MQTARNDMLSSMGAYLTAGGLAIGALIGLLLAAKATDGVMAFHGWLFLIFCVGGIVLVIRDATSTKPAAEVADGKVQYNDAIVKVGAVLSLFWGVAGFLAGDLIAWQLAFPALNFDLPWTNFGRMRPLHTSAVVFAFGGNVLLMSSFHIVQRTCRARLAGGYAPWLVLAGYNLFIVIAATGYLLGVTQSKEYAEPEWYADIWLTIVWVIYLLVFLGTLWRRKEPHIYVANWFILAFIVTVAMLHIVNNLSIPVSITGTKSVQLFSGVQDALTQWWYAHNAVGFFLTAGFLGIMYYYIPKRAERPVYSYRLSIVHFWSLIFLYIWAGPHHLHFTALPQWAQTLGMTFSVMLWMPSWGGMINGLMTLAGAWDKLKTDPVLRMLVTSVAFYGMSTFEGPLMSIRWVNGLSHYTDWTVGHVHSGALGWVGYVSFGAIYYIFEKLWQRDRLYSLKLVEWHYWVSTLGILLYIGAMWVSGILQGLMWRAYDEFGFLEYSFVETVEAMHWFYVFRAFGGLLFVAGSLIMVYNCWQTARGNIARKEPLEAPVPAGAAAVGGDD